MVLLWPRSIRSHEEVGTWRGFCVRCYMTDLRACSCETVVNETAGAERSLRRPLSCVASNSTPSIARAAAEKMASAAAINLLTRRLEEAEQREAALAAQLEVKDEENARLKYELEHTQNLLLQTSPERVMDGAFDSSAQVVVGLPKFDKAYRLQLMRIHKRLTGDYEDGDAGGDDLTLDDAAALAALDNGAGVLPTRGAYAGDMPSTASAVVFQRAAHARGRLTDIACNLREILRLQTTFYAWVNLMRKRCV